MKKLFFAVLLMAGFTACKHPVTGKNGVTYDTPASYNDYIVNRQSTLMEYVMDFSRTAKIDIDSANNLLKDASRATARIIDEVKGMPVYNGDSTLRDEAVQSFTFYKKVFDDYYVQVLEFRRKGADATQEDVDKIQGVIKTISDEGEGYDHDLKQAQERFAKKNNMRLSVTSTQKQMDKMTE